MKDPQIVAITQTTIEDNEGVRLTPEQFIAYVARVSNPSNQLNTDSTERLLTYLVKQGHWSPFDMVDMIVCVETSKAIAIQGLRHWSFRFQEFSQRYATVAAADWNHVEARMKDPESRNRQGSDDEVDPTWSDFLQGQCETAEASYQIALRGGVAPECARMVLPMATPTTMYFKGSVRSWMTYFWQRCDSHAQKEHRELATKIFNLFAVEFPCLSNLVRTHKPQVVEMDWMLL